MNGPEEFFKGLDDPEGTPTRLPAIDGVVSRGKQLRARRFTAIGASAAAVTAVVAVAAFGAIPRLSADHSSTTLLPATQPAGSATATASAHASSGGKQVVVIAPQARVTHHPQAVRPTPTTAPLTDPCTTPSPAVVDPSATAEPSAAPADSAATQTCTSPSASPTADATDSPTAEPPVTPSDSAAPAPAATG